MQKLVWINSKGTEINLTSGDYGITEWEGFSACDVEVQTQNVPFQDGSVFLDALLNNRELSVTLAINDGKDLEKRYRLRRELISALNPKLGEGYLIYTNDFISKRIKCLAQMPVFPTHNSDKAGTPKASLSWTACDPYWEDLEETEVLIKKGTVSVIENNGDLKTPIQIKILNGNIENPIIENRTSKQLIKINSTLVDKSVVINTGIGDKKVYETLDKINLISNYSLTHLCYSEDLKCFVGVSKTEILISKDSVVWNVIKPNISISEDLNYILYSKRLSSFFVVGNNGTLLKSNDALIWEQITIPQTYNLKDIKEINNKLFIGSLNYILVSENGTTWEESSSFINGNVSVSCYVGKYNLYFLSYDLNVYQSVNGLDWVRRTNGISDKVSFLLYSENQDLFFSQDTDTHKLKKSSDAITWTSYDTNIDNLLSSNLYKFDFILNNTESSYFSVKYYNVIFSSDMINFTVIKPYTGVDDFYYFTNLFFSKELGIFICYGKGKYYESYNLLNWFLVQKGYPNTSFTLANNDDTIYIGGYGGGGGYNKGLLNSRNITTWNSLNQYFKYQEIQYIEELGKFFYVGFNNGTVLYGFSKNVAGFSGVLPPNTTTVSFTYSKYYGKIIVVGDNKVKIGTILNNATLNWSVYDTGYNFIINSIASSNSGTLVCVGNNGNIIKSIDSLNWISVDSGTNEKLNSVYFSKIINAFVAVGDNGVILYSSDGSVWEHIEILTSENLNKVKYLNGFYIVGDNGLILQSADGKIWYQKEKLVSQNIVDIAYFLNKYICLASDGTIIYSEESEKTNIINKVDKSSNMNFSLDTGENIIFTNSADNNIFFSVLSYRQKYIGV
jgi:photosystem II stability/assembly factor-like uncharacterized protein